MSKKNTTTVIPQEARDAVARQIKGDNGKPAKGLQGAILRAVGVQRPLVLAYVKRLKSKHPDATAAQLALIAERDYLRTVTGTGAAGGATAVVPGLGTAASLGVSAGVTLAFLEASALYAQTMAELHGLAVTDPEQSKALVMAVVLGDEASGLLAGVSEQVAAGGRGGMAGVLSAVTGKGGAWSSVGKELQSRFLRRFAATQTASAFGRALPFGIGAAVGGVSSRVLGRKVVATTRAAFDKLPTLNQAQLAGAVQAAPGSIAEIRELERVERAEAEAAVEQAIELRRAVRGEG